MMEQKYCIVGTDKFSGIRKVLSGIFANKSGAEKNLVYWTDYHAKKIWKYVKVAKYPYKKRIN